MPNCHAPSFAVCYATSSIHSSNGVQASKLHINFSVSASLVMLNCDQTTQLHATCILLQHVLVGLIGCSLQAADAPLTLSTPHIQLWLKRTTVPLCHQLAKVPDGQSWAYLMAWIRSYAALHVDMYSCWAIQWKLDYLSKTFQKICEINLFVNLLWLWAQEQSL